MKDAPVMTHPLIELLNLEGYNTLSAEDNLSLFTNLKEALVADNKPIKGNDGREQGLMQPLEITDANSLWQAQSDLLLIMIGAYTSNVLQPLFDLLDDLSDGDSLVVGLDDLNRFDFPTLEDWKDNFNGDLDTLNDIRKSWSNVIDILNIGTDLDELKEAE